MKDFYGFLKKENNFLNLDFSKLNIFFDNAYNENKNNLYLNVASFNSIQAYDDYFLSEILSKIKNNFEIDEYHLKKVWLVKSRAETIDKGRLPFIPHIDKERYLKFMIYVSDVSEKDGPFFYCEKAYGAEEFEPLRKKIQHTSKNEKRNEIKDFPLASYKQVVGRKGDIIIFDTNIPHFAGSISGHGERKVIRFDLERKDWNSKRNLERIVSFIKKKLY